MFENSTFSPQNVFMLLYASQAAIISLHSIKSSVFITEKEYVYCVLQTEYLNIIEVKFSLYGDNEFMLLP